MSAEILREAAEVLRERAEKATPGVWKLWGMSVMADQDGTSNVETAVDVTHTLYRDGTGKPRTFDASYIAAMQPRVGLALADWLLIEAHHIASHDCEAHCPPDGCDEVHAAVNVARSILGRAA